MGIIYLVSVVNERMNGRNRKFQIQNKYRIFCQFLHESRMYFHFWTYFSDTQLYLQSIFVLSNVVQVVRIRNAVKDTFKTQVDFRWTLKPEINFHPLHCFKLIIRIFVRIFFPWASRSRAIGHRIHRYNCVVNGNVKAIATFVTLWHSYMSQNNVLRGCRRFIYSLWTNSTEKK